MWEEGEEPPPKEPYSSWFGCLFSAALVLLLVYGLYRLIF